MFIRYYYKQWYADKMKNLEVLDKSLEKYNFPKLNQEEIKNMNRPITSTEIKTVIKNLPTNKSPGTNDFRWILTKIKRIANTYPTQLFQKTAEEAKLPKSFYEATITLKPKPDKDATKKELQANITDEHRCKNP